MKSHVGKYPLGVLPENLPLTEEPQDEWDYELENMIASGQGAQLAPPYEDENE